MMKRLLILTALAFAAITAPASAYLHKDVAIFSAATTIGDVHKFHIGAQGYAHQGATWTYPDQCFSSWWDGQLPGQGCWKRMADNFILVNMALKYNCSQGNQNCRPTGNYAADVTGNDSCLLVRDRSSQGQYNAIYYPSGWVESPIVFQRYSGC